MTFPVEPPVILEYGMGDCRTFMNIPPLVHWDDGSTCINPDFDAVTKFHLAAKGIEFADRSLVTNVTINPGETVDFQLTVEREENGLGHLLINELLILTNPEGATDLTVQIKSIQGDSTYMNGPTPITHVFGNAHLNCCLPCPIMLYPNQTLILKVTNNEAFSVSTRITARGKRFMPYHNMSLISELERCWSMNPSSPYFASFDQGPITVPANGTAQGQITIPGGGWFQIEYIRSTLGSSDLIVDVTEGRIGKRYMNRPVRLGLYATEDLQITGFPGNLYRAASACHCPPVQQLVRGNIRMIHDFTNPTGAPITVNLTYVGCFHKGVDICPPQKDLDRVRRHQHMIDCCGGELFLDLADEEPCPPASVPAFTSEYLKFAEDGETPFPRPLEQNMPAPEPVPQVKQLWQPGDHGAPISPMQLPPDQAYAINHAGRLAVVQIDSQRRPIRYVRPEELPMGMDASYSMYRANFGDQDPEFRKWLASQGGGVSGLGQGEWEAL